MKSPTTSVGFIDPDGILNGSIQNERIRKTTTMTGKNARAMSTMTGSGDPALRRGLSTFASTSHTTPVTTAAMRSTAAKSVNLSSSPITAMKSTGHATSRMPLRVSVRAEPLRAASQSQTMIATLAAAATIAIISQSRPPWFTLRSLLKLKRRERREDVSCDSRDRRLSSEFEPSIFLSLAFSAFSAFQPWLLFHLKDGEERLLRDFDVAHLLHALLARLLLLEQLPLAGDVAAVALGEHVLPHRLDVFAGDDIRPDGRLHRDVEHLARDEGAHARGELAAAEARGLAVHDERQGVDAVAVDEDVQAHHVAGAEFPELVVEGGIAARVALQLVEEVHDDLGERHVVREDHLAADVLHVHLRAPLLLAQGHHGSYVLVRHDDRGADDGLAGLVDAARVGQLRGVVDFAHRAVARLHLVHHGRCRGDELHVVLALEPLLDNVHVQQAQEAAAEAEAQRLRGLGLVAQARIVQLQLLQRIAQRLVLVRFDGGEAREHLRLDLLEAGQRLGRGIVREGPRVAHLRLLQFL